MNSRVLVLGAAGRLGHKAAEAFRDAGWTVTSLVRPGRGGPRAGAAPRSSRSTPSTMPRSAQAARGADIILHALNPSYTTGRGSRCRSPIPPSPPPRAPGATLMFPGNLYNYGSPMPQVIDETTPMRPSSRKGQSAGGDGRPHGRGHRARHARDHSARRRFLRRRARIVARSRAAQGHRPRPPDLSRADRPGA